MSDASDDRLTHLERELAEMRAASRRHVSEFYWKTIIGPVLVAAVPVLMQILAKR